MSFMQMENMEQISLNVHCDCGGTGQGTQFNNPLVDYKNDPDKFKVNTSEIYLGEN